jgi:putative amino-acid transport system permease protein
MNFDFNYFVSVFPQILPYLPTTLFISIVSIFFAIIIGLIFALIKTANIFILSQIVTVYISFFRALPSVVLLFIVYYGLPQIFPVLKSLGAMSAAIMCFTLKFSAYLIEIFRAGLNSVEHGQKEAGLAIGLSSVQVYRRVILPQAFVNALPATGNIFTALLKDSSVAFIVGVADLLAAGKMLTTQSYQFFETYLAVGLIYWVVVVIYTWLQFIVEKKINTAYKR